MAGEPKPCEISEKCVRCRCIEGSIFRHLPKLTCLVLSSSSFLRYDSCGSEYWRDRYSATCRAGNSVSHTYPKSRARWMASPSTSDVSRVTFAALRRPAGRTPPSRDAFRHSGGDSRRCTSATDMDI
uniref:Uncharacterized protein n=1 Tax=Anopheles melas TaxID=34690 RepID=A0A182TLZ7_9DIPT